MFQKYRFLIMLYLTGEKDDLAKTKYLVITPRLLQTNNLRWGFSGEIKHLSTLPQTDTQRWFPKFDFGLALKSRPKGTQKELFLTVLGSLIASIECHANYLPKANPMARNPTGFARVTKCTLCGPILQLLSKGQLKPCFQESTPSKDTWERFYGGP